MALSSGGDLDKFWKIFDERLELCHRALMCRHNRLKGTLSDVAPILWQYGACARLKKGETIDKLLYHGYSTISLGYAGLYECVKYNTEKPYGPLRHPLRPAGDAVHERRLQEVEGGERYRFLPLRYALESTTYKFAKSLQRRFGIIEGVTDKSYITNSYHVHVTEDINAFDKLKFEAQFQALSPGGAISYVEVPDMQNNLEAVLQVMKFIYENIIYAELNTKSDYCQVCGWDGEIQIAEENGKLIWKCPQCGNTDQDKMNVARPDLRLHRNPVLEPGPDSGDPGPGAAPVKYFVQKGKAFERKCSLWPRSLAHLQLSGVFPEAHVPGKPTLKWACGRPF